MTAEHPGCFWVERGPTERCVRWGRRDRALRLRLVQLRLSRKAFSPLASQLRLIPLWCRVGISLALFGGRWPLAFCSSPGSALVVCFFCVFLFSGSQLWAKSLYNTRGLSATRWEKARVLPQQGSLARRALLEGGKAPDLEELLATCKYCCVAANSARLSVEVKEFRGIRASVCLTSRLFSTLPSV